MVEAARSAARRPPIARSASCRQLPKYLISFCFLLLTHQLLWCRLLVLLNALPAALLAGLLDALLAALLATLLTDVFLLTTSCALANCFACWIAGRCCLLVCLLRCCFTSWSGYWYACCKKSRTCRFTFRIARNPCMCFPVQC